MIASLLQLAGLVLVTVAAFMVTPLVGVVVAGVALFGIGLALEPPRRRDDRRPR